jgi:glycosyltransferase involved in cell wall biosynthesis
MKISVVINTLNEEKNIERAIKSVEFADEIIVCDMHSDDNTVILAKKLGAKIIFHKRTGFVEPARNFAISKAAGEWILILDADEEVPEGLAKKLKQIMDEESVATFVEIPRKNMIFGKWMQASMWWPDYNIRFFKKDFVKWSDKIHSRPEAKGQGITLAAEEHLALIHHHYTSVAQFVERNSRYSAIQAKELDQDGVEFSWKDLVKKPLGEFLGRYFANRGFEDGVQGLGLSLLQAFMFLLQYLYLWELQGYKDQKVSWDEMKQITKESGKELNYWLKYGNLSKNHVKRFLQKAKNKIT